MKNYELTDRLTKAFEFVRGLKEDWDTYGAPPIKTSTIERAYDISHRFLPEQQPDLDPMVNGSLALVWTRGEWIARLEMSLRPLTQGDLLIMHYSGLIYFDSETDFKDIDILMDDFHLAFMGLGTITILAEKDKDWGWVLVEERMPIPEGSDPRIDLKNRYIVQLEDGGYCIAYCLSDHPLEHIGKPVFYCGGVVKDAVAWRNAPYQCRSY